jgi:hypothetical protein
MWHAWGLAECTERFGRNARRIRTKRKILDMGERRISNRS